MWDLPKPEIEPMLPALAGGFLISGYFFLKIIYKIETDLTDIENKPMVTKREMWWG